MTRSAAIIVAGGAGLRAGGETPKQYRLLAGRPVLMWSVGACLAHPRVDRVVVAHPAGEEARTRDALEAFASDQASGRLVFVTGGATRSQSVRAGLARLADAGLARVHVHDAARPGLTVDVLDRLEAALDAGHAGAAPALPVADALWRAADESLDVGVDRAGLMRVQTPQSFDLSALIAAYATLPSDHDAADDVTVARAAGLRVIFTPGAAALDKLTWPEDFALMERRLSPPLETRVGHGLDAHRLVAGDRVTLCGVEIAHAGRLAGHSDADVAWHALADALYGALGEGDIGAHFPPGDMRWKGAASAVFLRHAAEMVVARGGRILNVDVTLVCEAPRVGPHREAMRARTAEVLGVALDRVSVKATTTEKMGFTGRGEGIAAQATAAIGLPAGVEGDA
jgi:2-C-methyl-D-erythritol 4-phosphate cytidylyltransferase/2-C-methyl-D-erythritol 2,4-cyclodiphosphate synthase